jgi:hypothetical protein
LPRNKLSRSSLRSAGDKGPASSRAGVGRFQMRWSSMRPSSRTRTAPRLLSASTPSAGLGMMDTISSPRVYDPQLVNGRITWPTTQ